MSSAAGRKGKNGMPKWVANKVAPILQVVVSVKELQRFWDESEAYENMNTVTGSSKEQFSTSMREGPSMNRGVDALAITSGKRRRSESGAKTPPPHYSLKKQATWSSPKEKEVLSGLLVGGSQVTTPATPIWTSFTGLLAVIPSYDIQSVLADNTLQHYNPHDHVVGVATLLVNLHAGHELGKGGFKTAHIGRLSIDASFEGSEFLVRPEGVCVKQFYLLKKRGDQDVVAWYQGALELEKAVTEANVHMWSSMLVDMPYTYMEKCLGSPDWPEVPCVTPQLCYVKAAIFMSLSTAEKSSSGKKAGSGGGPSGSIQIEHVFFIEELLSDLMDFVKYVHNSCAAPELDPEDPEFPKAEFLIAMQALQNGSTRSLFGDGNVPEAFDNFPKHHICNK
uniref:Uncharacterized protein n=1 Tax=Moniliophthora roreri TaxID=221103 RepID=A0A0W0GAA2_MONRR